MNNYSATQQMVYKGPTKRKGRVPILDERQLIQECFEHGEKEDWEWFKVRFGRSYALPHRMTNSGIWRSVGYCLIASLLFSCNFVKGINSEGNSVKHATPPAQKQ